MKLQLIVGSVREGRTAIKVATWAKQYLDQLGYDQLDTEIVDLKVWDLPFFAGTHPPASGIYDQPKQQQWADKIAEADAFLLISPEYNHGYTPVLKNALDYLGKEWQSKPVGFISYGSVQGANSVNQLRQVCVTLGMIDSNAVVGIRDIFSRNKDDTFQGNEFDEKALKSSVEKLFRYSNR